MLADTLGNDPMNYNRCSILIINLPYVIGGMAMHPLILMIAMLCCAPDCSTRTVLSYPLEILEDYGKEGQQ